jgi:hypothetical protein
VTACHACRVGRDVGIRRRTPFAKEVTGSTFCARVCVRSDMGRQSALRLLGTGLTRWCSDEHVSWARILVSLYSGTGEP